MGRKWCALALGIIASTAAFGQNQTCTVGKGETLSQIAARYGVPTIALAHANGINQIHRLKLGQVISIPESLHPKNLRKPQPGAVLRSSGLTGAPLQLFALSMLTQNSRASAHAASIERQASTKVAAKTKAPAKSVSIAKGKSYKVVEGDNDWVIARKIGSKPSLVRGANPNVDWSRLKIGTKLNLPTGATVAAKSAGSGNAIRTRRAIVARDAVNIRRGPTTNSAIVTTVNAGLRVTVLDRESGWYKLKFPRGTVGWVRGDMLKPASAAAYAVNHRSKSSGKSSTRNPRSGGKAPYNARTGNAVLDNALAMIGTRYRYGSASRKATDCSGFALQNYKKVGVNLPRRSRDQAHVGSAVSKGELKPGDLVFFHTGRSRRVNHVGIYKGNGEFVHASSAKGRVRVDKLSDGYYAGRYVGARRPTGGKTPKVAAAKPVEKATVQARESTSSAKPVGEHVATEDAGIK